MKSMQNYLDKYGRNFLVASMIPSLAFFTITMVSLKPILSDEIKEILGSEFNPLGESGLLLVLLTIIVGFTLTSLNTFIYKVFEGYVLIWRIPSLRISEQKRARNMREIYNRITKKIERLTRQDTRRSEQKRDNLSCTRDALLAEYDLSFPPSEDEILPTKFGNILKAAETYPMSRYRIDSVPIWPRLIHAMPNSYYSKVDETSNQLSFLMNCTILTFSYSLIALAASLYCITLSLFASSALPISAWIYFCLFIISLSIAVIFLRAAELVVTDYGLLIRSSFDLFRRDLLRKLELAPPLNLNDEQNLWEDVCEFMNIGTIRRKARFEFEAIPAQTARQKKDEISDN
jgi:hypothetical protein